MRLLRARRAAVRGITAIDVLCTLALVALLASAAWPAYREAVGTARRGDGLAALWRLQIAQERHHARHRRYGTLAEVGVAPRSPAGHYRLELVQADAGAFEARASAAGAGPDLPACRHLTLRVEAGRVWQSSGPDAVTVNPDAVNRRCWSR